MTQNSAPTGSSRRRSIQGFRGCPQAHSSMPTSRRRPPLPRRTSSAPRRWSRSDSLSASASWMRSPARHSTTISPRNRCGWRPFPRGAHHGNDLLDIRRIRRVAVPLVARRVAGVESGHRRGDRRRPAASSSNSVMVPPRVRRRAASFAQHLSREPGAPAGDFGCCLPGSGTPVARLGTTESHMESSSPARSRDDCCGQAKREAPAAMPLAHAGRRRAVMRRRCPLIRSRCPHGGARRATRPPRDGKPA